MGLLLTVTLNMRMYITVMAIASNSTTGRIRWSMCLWIIYYYLLTWWLVEANIKNIWRSPSPFQWEWDVFQWQQLFAPGEQRNQSWSTSILLCQVKKFCWRAPEGIYPPPSRNHLALVKLNERNKGPSNGFYFWSLAQRRQVAGT